MGLAMGLDPKELGLSKHFVLTDKLIAKIGGK
jgi:heterodisulfide reductase subunit B